MPSSHRPSFGEMLFFLSSGIIVSVPMALFFEPSTGFLSNFFSGWQAEILAVAVLAPIVEEFAKAYPLFYRHGESQKSLFMMGFLVGIGFGITEFFGYVLLVGVSPLIRLPGIFFHAALTSIIAYGIAARQSMPFYLVSVLLHASANLLAEVGVTGLPIALAFATAFFISFFLYNKASEQTISY